MKLGKDCVILFFVCLAAGLAYGFASRNWPLPPKPEYISQETFRVYAERCLVAKRFIDKLGRENP